MRFDDFSERNDPFGEHDFGAIEYEGNTVFWKIDYYDLDLMNHSPDPSDPTCDQTCTHDNAWRRVLGLVGTV